ncbi:MAG TPA: DNA recombination protein RmuC [Alphaproteobacteria bacterium]|nr:DNA recombination protein RmuC [Alphaproteobacteria bacterium]
MMPEMGAMTLAAAVFLALIAVVVFLALRRRGPDAATVFQQQSELVGRLAQMAEQSAAAQAQMAAQLREQESAIAKVLEQRLAQVDKRLNEGLEQSRTATQTTIADVRERLVKIDEAQKNIAQLSTHVVGLSDILSNKQARGAFGEEQLEAIVRDQLPAAHYEFQATLSNRNRADCLIKLPPPLGPLAVDAKFPREAWDAMREAGADEAARNSAARAFAGAIAAHVKAIAEKYIVPGETADAALMFVPSEAIYAEIYAAAGEIADRARRARVFIVSPTTLWAVLNTMRAILKDARMREQAHVIQREIGELLEDVRRLDERVGQLKTHFASAEKDIRQIETSADRISRRGARIHNVDLDDPLDKPSLAPPAQSS